MIGGAIPFSGGKMLITGETQDSQVEILVLQVENTVLAANV
jgi:hypothetical protein